MTFKQVPKLLEKYAHARLVKAKREQRLAGLNPDHPSGPDDMDDVLVFRSREDIEHKLRGIEGTS